MESGANFTETDRKASIQRSAAYPAITIQSAVDFVSHIKKSFPNSSFSREDIIAVLKKSAINRDTGAAVHYGLLEKPVGEGYKVSDRAKIILNPISDEEKASALIECFRSPKLYIELIEKFEGHVLPPDQQLRAVLSRQHGITESAAPQAAEVFVENAIYVGLLDEHRILRGDTQSEVETSRGGSSQVDEQSGRSPYYSDTIVSSQENLPAIQQKRLLLEEMNGSVDIKIHLSERKIAHLIYPENINERDIQILKLQLEALALTL